jgi:uncharacterized membrane protein YdjX (TVP38/TMEM64 family)
MSRGDYSTILVLALVATSTTPCRGFSPPRLTQSVSSSQVNLKKNPCRIQSPSKQTFSSISSAMDNSIFGRNHFEEDDTNNDNKIDLRKPRTRTDTKIETNKNNHHPNNHQNNNAAQLATVATISLGILLALRVFPDSLTNLHHLNPTATLESVVATVQDMGPMGVFYFSLFYIAAEVLAIPAFPLTASAGYLFGVAQGTAVVLFSASVAASISFFIGRTILRTFVEQWLQDFPDFSKLDRAIGRQGFQLMLLLRLSPIFPFAVSNYLYGASSVGFWQYFWGTMLGFTPGTIAYVYSGTVGKALMDGDVPQPWYVYAGGFMLLAGLLKLIANVATNIIEELEQEEENPLV